MERDRILKHIGACKQQMSSSNDEQLNRLRARLSVLSREMKKQKRQAIADRRAGMIDSLYEAVRDGEYRTAHRLGRQLSNTGIGAKPGKFWNLLAEISTAEQTIEGMKRSGTGQRL